MKRGLRSLLMLILCAGLAIAPVWAMAEEDDEESLRWLLSRQTEQEKFDNFYYGDYDADGIYEAFALVGVGSNKEENPSGELWFISGRYVGKIDDERSYLQFKMCGGEGRMLFSAEEWYGGSGSTTRLWTVEKSEPVQVEDRMVGHMTYNGGNEFVAYIDAFDMCSDGTGHTWKPYYYFLEGTSMREYGGMYITREDLLKFDGAKEILQGVKDKGYQIDDIIYRENGVINVNIRDTSSSLIWYDNLTLRYDETSVTDTGERYGGVYDLANDPSIAIYPTAFKAPANENAAANAESPLELVWEREDTGACGVYLQKGDSRVYINSYYPDVDWLDYMIRVYRMDNGNYFVLSWFDGTVYRLLRFENGDLNQLKKIGDPNYSDGMGLRDPDTFEDIWYVGNDDLENVPSDWTEQKLNGFFDGDGIAFGRDGMTVQGELLAELTGDEILKYAELEPRVIEAASAAETPAKAANQPGADGQIANDDTSIGGVNTYAFNSLDTANVVSTDLQTSDGITEAEVLLQDDVFAESEFTMGMYYTRPWSTVDGILADAEADLDGDGQNERIALYTESLTDEQGDFTRESVIVFEAVDGEWMQQDSFVYDYDTLEPYSEGARLRLINAPDGVRLARLEWGAMDGGRFLAQVDMYAYNGSAIYRSEMAQMEDYNASFFFKGRMPMNIYEEMSDARASESKDRYNYLQANCEGDGVLFEHAFYGETPRCEGFEGVGAKLSEYGLTITYEVSGAYIEDFNIAGGDEFFSVSRERKDEGYVIQMRMKTALDHFPEQTPGVAESPAASGEGTTEPPLVYGAETTEPPLVYGAEAASVNPSEVVGVDEFAGSYAIDCSSVRSGNAYDVSADTVVDGRLDTAWNTYGRSVGEWISFAMPDGREGRMAGLRIVNGYAKSDKTYKQNARARTVALYCDSQLVERFTIEDHDALQTFYLAEPAHGKMFRMVIEEVYSGSKYSDLCITEIELLGENDEDFHNGTLDDWGRAVDALAQKLEGGATLKKGASGYEVMGLQLLLGRGFGLLTDAVDGSFGGNTAKALNSLMDQMRAWDTASQLEPMRDGVADASFIRNLRLYIQNL